MERRKSLNESLDFLVKSIDPRTNGSRAFYSLFLYPHKGGWSNPYPETTGYIIKTFDDLIYEKGFEYLEESSLQMADWLLSIQHDDGAFSGGLYDKNKINEKSIFNTAQIIIGLHSRYIRTNKNKYLEAGIKASNWLGECINDEGYFYKHHYHSGFMPSYYTRVCWPLLLFKDNDGYNSNNIEGAKKVLNNIKAKQLDNFFIADSGFKPNSYAFLHTIAYTLRGFLECSIILNDDDYFKTCYNLSEIFMKKFEIKKQLAGAYYDNFNELSNFRCLTGEAQIIIIWNKLSQITNDFRFLNSGLKLLDSLEKNVPMFNTSFKKGGLSGSKPFYGRYISLRQPNWASKFLIDAILEEDKTIKLLP